MRQFTHVKLPPTVPISTSLFTRVHVDVMLMSEKSEGYKYIVQGRDSLTGYSEFRLLRKDTFALVAKFIFEDIICR